MSHQKFLGALALTASTALAGNALAQSGTGTMPGGAPPDTSMPSEPAQHVDPSAGSGSDTMSGDSRTSSKSASSTTQMHGKKKKKAATHKPADNDNNARPNSASPSASPQ